MVVTQKRVLARYTYRLGLHRRWLCAWLDKVIFAEECFYHSFDVKVNAAMLALYYSRANIEIIVPYWYLVHKMNDNQTCAHLGIRAKYECGWRSRTIRRS